MAGLQVDVIGGREWTAAELAERCGITPSAARTRLRRWRRGEIGEAELLHAGKRHGGGNSGIKAASHATAEWRRLDDSPRSEARIDCTPGTWEREHCRPQARRMVSRRYVLGEDREHGERGGIYYNPARVAL